jgi:hypothetical protein
MKNQKAARTVKIETVVRHLFEQAIAQHIATVGSGITWKQETSYNIDGYQVTLLGADLCGAGQVSIIIDGVKWFTTLTNDEKNSRLPATHVCGAPKKAWVPQPDLDLRPSSERIAEALSEIAAGRV